MTNKFKLIIILIFFLMSFSCTDKNNTNANNKVWAWYAGKLKFTSEQWDTVFLKASKAGIDAIILECHGGYPEVIGDTMDLVDNAAMQIIKNALPYAKKHNIELHSWIWTTNRCEQGWRKLHPDFYQVNAQGESCLDIKLYNREHYRWLCPSRPENLEYLKDRVRELAQIEGLAGVHLDFIRYPDAILPYALHESRGVVQDKVYPLWDFCYCNVCRSNFKSVSGIDPLDLEDPTANEQWMEYRWSLMAKFASEIATEIKSNGKIASAAVFASPYESKKLVRQDWANFNNMDYLFPMLYHKFYGWDDMMVETATREGVEALAHANNPAALCTGLFTGHVPAERLDEFFEMARNGGSQGICLFSIEGIENTPGYWEALEQSIKKFKNK